MAYVWGRGGDVQMMSAITVPSGSMADVYCRAKGKVTLVKVLAGNLRKRRWYK